MSAGNAHRLVVKFGGKSLSSGALVRRAAEMVRREAEKGRRVVVITSAMGDTTDRLIRIAEEASTGRISLDWLDDILSMGERTSARVFASALNALGVKAHLFDPSGDGWPIVTDENFTNADPLLSECKERVERYVLPLLAKGIVPVIPGFVGRSKDGRVTTLGRGGSDVTALLVSRLVGAQEVILVTDVDGVMTADPKLVGDARVIRRMTVKDLLGLADCSAKFIHGKALRYKDPSIDLKIVSHRSNDLNRPGTVVTGSFPLLGVELAVEEPVVTVTFVGHAIMESPAVILEILDKIKGRDARILGLSANKDSMTIYADSITDGLLKELHSVVTGHEEAVAMAVRRGLALVRVKGVGLEEMPGVIERISEPLSRHKINIFDMSTITSSVLVFVDWGDRDRAIRLIEESLRGEPCST